jgi:hypothetical protein
MLVVLSSTSNVVNMRRTPCGFILDAAFEPIRPVAHTSIAGNKKGTLKARALCVESMSMP